MSSKIITLSEFTIKQPARKEEKVMLMPNFFSNVLKKYKQKIDEIKNRKINILFDVAYKYYYDLFENQMILKVQSNYEVDIPDFIYEIAREKRAKEKASEAVMDIVKANRVGECFKLYKQNQRRGK